MSFNLPLIEKILMKLLPIIALSFSIAACGGSEEAVNPFAPVLNDTPGQVAQTPTETTPEPPQVETPAPEVPPVPRDPIVIDPITVPVVEPVIPDGFGSHGVLGSWYCAATFEGEGQFAGFRSDWNNPWQLNFRDDQTVVLQDGSNTVSSWWYTGNGVTIQWSHNGNTAEYVTNVENRGGMADDGSHCLRELPPTESAPEPAVETLVQLTAYQCQRGPETFQIKLDTEGTQAEIRGVAGSYTRGMSGVPVVATVTVTAGDTTLYYRDYNEDLSVIGDPGASGAFGTNCRPI